MMTDDNDDDDEGAIIHEFPFSGQTSSFGLRAFLLSCDIEISRLIYLYTMVIIHIIARMDTGSLPVLYDLQSTVVAAIAVIVLGRRSAV